MKEQVRILAITFPLAIYLSVSPLHLVLASPVSNKICFPWKAPVYVLTDWLPFIRNWIVYSTSLCCKISILTVFGDVRGDVHIGDSEDFM